MATGANQPFKPNGTAAMAASTTSTSATLAAGDAVLVFNSTGAVAFVATGIGSATATPAGVPVPPGGSRLMALGIANTVAVILASGSGTVYATAGTGSVY